MTDRVSALAANVAALRARFGRGFDHLVIRGDLSVSTPAEAWPDDAVPRLRLGELCVSCGCDDWVFRSVKRKTGGIMSRVRECRPCANERCREKAKRRARAALGAIDGRTA